MNAPETVAADFLFLRPWCLLVLPVLFALYAAWRRRRRTSGVWAQHVDAHLLPHLLVGEADAGAQRGGWLFLLAAVLLVLALAGPSWRQQALPLWQQDAPLVIALDLSAGMRATDLAPSRLAQARAKVAALLKARRAGQVGLMVYAGEPFTVAPITPDGGTVAAFLDSLTPDLMPVEGQRADLAIAHAVDLLQNSGAARGDILLLTDQVDASANAAAATAAKSGMRVSVIGVGTLAGAPLAGAQGFITDAAGKPRLARLDPASLAELANAGGGAYQPLSIDDSDLRAIDVLDPQSAPGASTDSATQAGLQRSDDGYWLLLVAVPLLALAFRRGWLMSLPLLLCLTLMPGPRPLLAAETPENPSKAPAPAAPGALQSFWDGLWQRSDQRAWRALEAGDAANARRLARDPAMQGAAAFREQDYDAAIHAWSGQPDADGHYNRGNALAASGKLKEAIAAYDEALKQSPGMEDAIANRKAVEDLLRQQQQQQQSGQSGEQQPKDQQSEQQDGQSQSGNQPQQQDGQQGEQSQSQDTQQQNEQTGEQSQSEQESAESQNQDGAAKDEASKANQSDQGAGEDQSEPAKAAQTPSAEQQQAAEQAAREQIEQALQAGEADQEAEGEARVLTPAERAEAEREQALQQWLRRVPDDPGGLLRRKFELEHRRRQAADAEDEQ